MTANVKGGLVVVDRPQISVGMTEDGEITIDVARIGDNFKDVEIESVRFPADCAEHVAQALLDLLKT